MANIAAKSAIELQITRAGPGRRPRGTGPPRGAGRAGVSGGSSVTVIATVVLATAAGAAGVGHNRGAAAATRAGVGAAGVGDDGRRA